MHFFCDSCLATQNFKHAPKGLLYTNFNDNAPYLAIFLTTELYKALEAVLSPWIKHIPAARLEFVFWDLLHVLWTGIGRDLVASMIVEFHLDKVTPWGSASEVYVNMTLCCKDWCKRCKISRVKYAFTSSSLQVDGGGFAELASYFKGMHVKTICKWLASKSMERLDGTQTNLFDLPTHPMFPCTCVSITTYLASHAL